MKFYDFIQKPMEFRHAGLARKISPVLSMDGHYHSIISKFTAELNLIFGLFKGRCGDPPTNVFQ